MTPVTGQRWPSRHLRPCGTEAAYRRHLRHHELPCDPCLQAHNDTTTAARHRAVLELAVSQHYVRQRKASA
jgi:hypothetical protein